LATNLAIFELFLAIFKEFYLATLTTSSSLQGLIDRNNEQLQKIEHELNDERQKY
jgi:hypothetical protein